jgi:hypothetical protein
LNIPELRDSIPSKESHKKGIIMLAKYALLLSLSIIGIPLATMEKQESPKQFKLTQRGWWEQKQEKWEAVEKKEEKTSYISALRKACIEGDTDALHSIPAQELEKIALDTIEYPCSGRNCSCIEKAKALDIALNYSQWDIFKHLITTVSTIKPSPWDLVAIIQIDAFSNEEKIKQLDQFVKDEGDINTKFKHFLSNEGDGFMDKYIYAYKEQIDYNDPVLVWFIKHITPNEEINNVAQLLTAQQRVITRDDLRVNKIWIHHTLEQKLPKLNTCFVTTLLCLEKIGCTFCPKECAQKHDHKYYTLPKPLNKLIYAHMCIDTIKESLGYPFKAVGKLNTKLCTMLNELKDMKEQYCREEYIKNHESKCAVIKEGILLFDEKKWEERPLEMLQLCAPEQKK